ncbi:glutamate--tRNA ligase [Holospora curviuscula]|uniref:Glutamate--tRNA ligase 1 n=1 Tax=Holospora curviuscula TaxID=1082868 RepID=A0A2S5RAA3_9PROT|nr:glutamate--tRNA ligase family protein [Holospora curviuscula]PPE04264.1 Glutamate--tRNA ligase 1 [Holospora curviuscula]
MSTPPRVRFAPSPTGFLHLGNARIALFNWIFARKYGGSFILRIDDTDQERSETRYVEALKKDLRWLEIEWDICFSQSERRAFYLPYIEQLKSTGHLYPCCETPQELDVQRAQLRSHHHAPIFNKETRRIDPTRPMHWRFSLKKCKISWNDGVQGICQYDTSHISDPVVIREDGSLSYLLTSVLDDQDPQHPVTHVIRGVDHYVNTAIQSQIFEALGKSSPIFMHLPLLQHKTGEKFSKRTQGQGVQDWRAAGALPKSLSQVLLNLSCNDPMLSNTLRERISDFSWDSYSKASEVRLDPEAIWNASNYYFSIMSWEELQIYFVDFPCKYLKEAHWRCISSNVCSFLDIQAWDRVFDPQWSSRYWETEEPFGNLLRNPQYVEAIFFQWKNNLDKTHGVDEVYWKKLWKNLTQTLTQQFDLKLSLVCSTIRWMITGKKNGPPMVTLFALLGKQCIENRLTPTSEKLEHKTE